MKSSDFPIIGVTSVERGNYDGWFESFHVYDCRADACQAIALADGVPMILPVINNSLSIEAYIETIDGLFLTGGYDVFPGFYNEDTLIGNGNFYPKTDIFDITMIKAAYKKKMPILCVCRGLQVANVTFGGKLYQDIFNEKEDVKVKHNSKEVGDLLVHKITVEEPHSLFSSITGYTKDLLVNSIHHQAIKDLAPIFKVVAKSDDDIIEVIELKDNPDQWFLGVQFHPEILANRGHDKMRDIFDAFVKASTQYRNSKHLK